MAVPVCADAREVVEAVGAGEACCSAGLGDAVAFTDMVESCVTVTTDCRLLIANKIGTSESSLRGASRVNEAAITNFVESLQCLV